MKQRLRDFGSGVSGSIVIEFALLGPLCILLIVAFVYFASLSLTTLRLNTAVAQAALVLGQEHHERRSDAELRELICSFAGLSNCGARLAISVEPLNDYGDRHHAHDGKHRGGGSLRMKVLSARYETGAEVNALSRIVLGAGERPDVIRASAMFVSRDS